MYDRGRRVRWAVLALAVMGAMAGQIGATTPRQAPPAETAFNPIPGLENHLIVTVGDATIAVGGTGFAIVMVKDSLLWEPVSSVPLNILEYNINIISALWPDGRNWTDGLGTAAVEVGGKAVGSSSLKVEASPTGDFGTGTTTVANPVVSVSSVTVTVGGNVIVLVLVHATVGTEPAKGVALSIDYIDTSVARASWNWRSVTDTSGYAAIDVSGVSAGSTDIRINATASGATGTGTVTVTAP